MVSFSPLSVILLISSLLRYVSGFFVQNITKRDTVRGPVISLNFPDPSLIWVSSENSWFAFATNGNGVNVQLATSPDFDTWSVCMQLHVFTFRNHSSSSQVTGQDALPTVGAWVDQVNPAVWAPMVIQIVKIALLSIQSILMHLMT